MTAWGYNVRLSIAFAALMLVFAIKGILIRPPSPPATVASNQFDAARAAARLTRILGDQRPHPVDSAANDAVRARLIDELRALGVTPTVRERMDCNGTARSRTVSCSLTRNIVATIGPTAGRHLLLNAHYDSTPTGPGASDDGIGVAVMLEIAAELRRAPPARPVTLLFNEGEEFGLNGARAFLEGDPLASRVDTLINVESRGVDGPALMFETSSPNGPALAAYASATRRPYANSISSDLATLIPNTTDVTVFKERGWKTLSYSIIGNETRYHSPGDTIDALDRSSLHHLGGEVMAATRALSGHDVATGGGRMVFADIAGRGFVALPLAIAALVLAGLLIGTALLAYRRKALGGQLLIVARAVVGAVLAAVFAGEMAALIRASDYWRAYPLVAYLAVYATLLAAEAALLVRFARTIDRDRLRIACWLLILTLGGTLGLLLPGATIFFLASPLIALAALAIGRRSERASAILLWVAALFQLLLFAELLASIELLLIDGPLWAVAPLAALAALPFLIEAMPAGRSRLLVWPMAVAALGLWTAALVVPRMSEERPGGFAIEYIRDDLRGKANWAVSNKLAPLPTDWHRFGQWRGAVLPHSPRRRWIVAAPLLDVPRPAVRLVSSVADGQGRRVLLAMGRGGANTVTLKLARNAALVAMGLPGQMRAISPKARPGRALLRCSGRACDGLVVELRFADRAKVRAELIGSRFALPAQGRPLAAARPPLSHPQYLPDSSVRIRGVMF